MIYDANKGYDVVGMVDGAYMCHQSCAKPGQAWQPYTNMDYFDSIKLCVCANCQRYFNPVKEQPCSLNQHFI